MGLIPIDSPPVEEPQRFVHSEIDRWGKVIQRGRHRGIGVTMCEAG